MHISIHEICQIRCGQINISALKRTIIGLFMERLVIMIVLVGYKTWIDHLLPHIFSGNIFKTLTKFGHADQKMVSCLLTIVIQEIQHWNSYFIGRDGPNIFVFGSHW